MDEKVCKVPRVMIAAPHGRSGKTVLVLGLLCALRRRGIAVQPFKKGPDFIDPGWHSIAAGRDSRNLDCFFMDTATMNDVICQASEDAAISIIEGAMGFYDGLDLAGSSSSAEVAKQTRTPVILVIDVTRMTRSVAAIVMGFMQFDPAVQIAGVILNRVQGARQENLTRAAIEQYCGVPVFGAIPKDTKMNIPDRHLGLTSNTEVSSIDTYLDGIADIIEQHVDIDAVLAAAALAPPVTLFDKSSYAPCCDDADDRQDDGGLEQKGPNSFDERVRIAVVRDQVFSFYYPENLLALAQAGANLVFVNSLEDAALPDNIHGLFIGGGFPEVFAEQLQANESFRTSVKNYVERGLPVYAECGGLMYLARTIQTPEGTFDMAGALGFDVVMEEKSQGHGYAVIEAKENHPWLPAGAVLKGHEHHHSKVTNRDPDLSFVFKNQRGHGIADGQDGVCYKGVVAAYTHIHTFSAPQWAPGFVRQAQAYRAELGDD